jgi:hypothetical protein
LGAKIPQTIKKAVIRDWLHGIPRDQIASRNQIGAGTVSTIVNECREGYSDFDLLREVAVELHKEHLSIGDFAFSMRLRNRIIDWSLNDDQIENFIEIVNVYCFKAEIDPAKFVDMIHKAIYIANRSKTPVDKLPSQILKRQRSLKLLNQKVALTRRLERNLLSAYHLAINELPGIIDENEMLKKENNILKKTLADLRDIDIAQYTEIFEYRYSEMISEHELRKLDQVWFPDEPRMSVKELHAIAHEIYHEPIRYIDIIRHIRKNRVNKEAA